MSERPNSVLGYLASRSLRDAPVLAAGEHGPAPRLRPRPAAPLPSDEPVPRAAATWPIESAEAHVETEPPTPRAAPASSQPPRPRSEATSAPPVGRSRVVAPSTRLPAAKVNASAARTVKMTEIADAELVPIRTPQSRTAETRQTGGVESPTMADPASPRLTQPATPTRAPRSVADPRPMASQHTLVEPANALHPVSDPASLLAPEPALARGEDAEPTSKTAPHEPAPSPPTVTPFATPEDDRRSAKPTSPPQVLITIGRVEVRATAREQPAPRRTPAMSLDSYLLQRSKE